MTTLKHKHRSALNHAIYLLRSAISRCPDGAVKDGIREDVRLLKQIDKSIRNDLVSPALPFAINTSDAKLDTFHEDFSHGPTYAGSAA